MSLNIKIQYNVKKHTFILILSMFFLSCSTSKNKTLNKGYHSIVSNYNVLFNGENYINEGLLQAQESFVDDFWEILPIEKISLSKDIITVDGTGNENFLKSEEKAAKTIQKHSMLINNVQYNSKIAQAHLLLGRARYLDQRFIPALDAFNQIYKEDLTFDEWCNSVIWKAKCNIRLEQEKLALGLLSSLLKKEKLTSKIKADANATLAMAYLQLQKNDSAIKPLKVASSNEKNKQLKARYLYVLGQIYEEKNEKDSAYATFKKITNFKRSIPRIILINAKIKTLLKGTLSDNEPEFKKTIDNIENEPFLDKIYYGYSKLLFSKDSISKAIFYLNKALKQSPHDKKLLSKGYEKLSEINFKKSNYVASGKYLDSTLNNLEKNSKKFWELSRRKKGLDRVVKLEENIILYDSLIKISTYEPYRLKEILNHIESKNKRTEIIQQPKEIGLVKTKNNDSFYFYNSQLLELGKKAFKKIWGQRARKSYWRSVTSNSVTVLEETKKITPDKGVLKKIKLVNQGLLAKVPMTKFQKDSINNLKNKSYLRLAEIYLEKYNDYLLAESKLSQLININPSKDILVEANYLLYKSYKKQNKTKANKLRLEIIKEYPTSKFAKILKDRNKILEEEKGTLKKLDSLNSFFSEQKFEEVLIGIEKQVAFIENKEILIDFELLRAQTMGKLEGVLKYKEELKNITQKHPSSAKSLEIKKIYESLNKKWQTNPKKIVASDYNIVFIINKEEFLVDSLLNSLKKAPLNNHRIAVDVYDNSTRLIVIKDIESKKEASKLLELIKEKIEFLRLKNNFVVLSSQYKNILIFKTLDLN